MILSDRRRRVAFGRDPALGREPLQILRHDPSRYYSEPAPVNVVLCNTPAVELGRGTAELYMRHAYAQMLEVADRLGDQRVNDRPIGTGTNAVAALVVHCCGVTEFWIGHVALGRPTRRDRDSEFTITATVAELHDLVDRTLAQLSEDLAAIAAGKTQADRTGRQFLEGGDESDAAIVLHVIEELYQHLGHMEITADALMVRG
jgi:uncharacterized damage-inducible protein DinB